MNPNSLTAKDGGFIYEIHDEDYYLSHGKLLFHIERYQSTHLATFSKGRLVFHAVHIHDTIAKYDHCSYALDLGKLLL